MEKGNEIARLCVEKFDKARKKIKEIEWEILAGVVVEKDGKFSVVSLATGSKCLGKSKLAPLGNLLNDCHAEVLVRRVPFDIEQCVFFCHNLFSNYLGITSLSRN